MDPLKQECRDHKAIGHSSLISAPEFQCLTPECKEIPQDAMPQIKVKPNRGNKSWGLSKHCTNFSFKYYIMKDSQTPVHSRTQVSSLLHQIRRWLSW